MINSYFSENTLQDLLDEIRYVYMSDERPWIIGYSGGKDSTVVTHLVYTMLKQLLPEERHKTVYIVSSDTLVENPLIKIYLDQMLQQIQTAANKDHSQEKAVETYASNIKATEIALQELEAKKTAAIDEKNSLEAQFKKSGGLSKNERDELNNKLRQYDRAKNEYSRIIRDYVENLMPFYITYDLSCEIDTQLPREERMHQYHILIIVLQHR